MAYTHTNIKSFVNNGSYQYTKIGRHILVWSAGGKQPTGNRGVIISAHGCQTAFNSTFTVPASTTVLFYCPHGYSLVDPQMIRIARGEIAPNGDPLTTGKNCTDYSLGKFQGKHGGKDTDSYEQIGTNMHPQYLKMLAEEYDMEQKEFDEIQYDIVTIRHRNVGSAPKLSDVIKQLNDNGFHYNEIHCSFCRSPGLPWKKEKGAWEAAVK